MSYTLRTVGTFQTLDEIQNLVLRADGLRLRDVADVVYQEPPLEYGRHLDGRFAVGISVSKDASANSVAICRQVRARVAEMDKDPELEGVNFLVWFDQGKEIEKTLRSLAMTGVFGALFAGAVLFLFLRRLSMTLVASLCIPFSLIVTCGAIWAQGKTLNTLSLLGLIVGVGMLVDNAVVVMENIFRHREEGLDRTEATRVGAREVSLAVTAATLTSVIVFLPVIFNKPSEMNIYLRELGLTVCMTLLASLFISQTLIPLATSRFIHTAPKPKGRLMLGLEERYVKTLRFNLRHRWLTPVIGLAVTASAVYPFMKIDKNFDATEAESFVQVRYEFSEELNLDRKRTIVERVEAILEPHRKELSTKSIYSFWSSGWSLTRLYMEDGKANEKAMNRTRAQLRQLLPEIPGLKLEVQDTGNMWRHDRGKRIAFQVVGEDSEMLARLGEEAKQRLSEIPGLTEAFTSAEAGRQELYVDLDRELAMRYGVPMNQPAQVVGLTYRGQRLPRFRTPDGEREMRLTLDETAEESLSQLRNLPLWTVDGAEGSAGVAGQLPGGAGPGAHPAPESRDQHLGGSALRGREPRGLHAAGHRGHGGHRLPVRLHLDLLQRGATTPGAIARVPREPAPRAAPRLRGDGRDLRVGAPGPGAHGGAAVRAGRRHVDSLLHQDRFRSTGRDRTPAPDRRGGQQRHRHARAHQRLPAQRDAARGGDGAGRPRAPAPHPHDRHHHPHGAHPHRGAAPRSGRRLLLLDGAGHHGRARGVRVPHLGASADDGVPLRGRLRLDRAHRDAGAAIWAPPHIA